MLAEKAERKRPESWGSIRKLPSGRYQASYTGPDGQRYTARTESNLAQTFDLKTDARDWLAMTRRQIQRGEWESPSDRAARVEREQSQKSSERFAVYAEKWIRERRTKKGQPLRQKTRLDYERQLRVGLALFADDSIGDITPARVREWHAVRAEAAATAAGNDATLLRAILNTAIIDGVIAVNPVAGNLTQTKTGVYSRVPTTDELTVILKTMAGELRLAIVLGAYGSLRLSEWRALRRMDLRFDETRYWVDVHRQAVPVAGGWQVGPPKSKEGVRVVPLPPSANDYVTTHLERFVKDTPEALLFAPKRHSEFMHNRQFNDPWNVARVAAGVRTQVGVDDKGRPIWKSVVREHDLRAFAATTHAQSGATLKETMAFLGHSTTAAAMVYQATTGREAELADRMTVPVFS